MGSFLVAFAAVSRQELVGLALGSRWGRPSPLAEPLLQQVGPPNGKHQSTGFRAGMDRFWTAMGRQDPCLKEPRHNRVRLYWIVLR